MPFAVCFGPENLPFLQGKNLLPDVEIFRKSSEIRKHPAQNPDRDRDLEKSMEGGVIKKKRYISSRGGNVLLLWGRGERITKTRVSSLK